MENIAQASVMNLMQQVRDLGYYPKANAGRSLAERQLAWKLRTVMIAKQFSPEQEAELQARQHASSKQEEDLMQQVSPRRAEELIQQVRNLGHPHNKRPSSSCSSQNCGMLAHKTGMQAQGFCVGLPPGTRRRIVA